MFWHDGRITPTPEVPFDLRDRGLLLADGLFETVLVLNGIPFRLDAHLARMAGGAEVLRLPLDLDPVRQAVLDLAAGHRAGVVRVTATRGAGARGLAIPAEAVPTVFAAASPWTPALAFGRQRLATAAIRRNETSPLSRIKSLAYLDNVLAHEAARRAGADDALMLSGGRHVACTGMANLFVLHGRKLATPPLADGVLPGIMRALVLDAAPSLGFDADERTVDPAELEQADAVFSTNSVRLLTAVTSLDGRPLHAGNLDPLVEAVKGALAAECGAVPVPAEVQGAP